jgi:hypothetical protein
VPANAVTNTPGALVPSATQTEPQLKGSASSPGAGKISFQLEQPGKVSLAIYDVAGQMVRTLLNATPFAAGNFTVDWDGKDDAGNALPRGTYTYKLLQTPGLRAEYLMTLQSSLPIGSNWVDREVGVGNHDGVTAVTTDATGVYVGSGISETTFNALKMTPDGTTRIWSAHQPDISMGRYAMAVMNGQLYSLQQDGWVSYHAADKPNWGWSSVGVTASAAGNGDYVGVRWDAQWPGSIRGDANAWAGPENSMDLAAYDSGNNPQLVISHRDQNIVQWRNPSDGAVLDGITIAAPKGVAFDNAGNLLVLSKGQILRVSRTNRTPVVIAQGLTAPFRLDVDRSTGEIIVADGGASQQMKRFSSNGILLVAYGRQGGRQYGLYEPKNFLNVNDVSSDNNGGFWITERSTPRRVAHLARDGSVIGEWYAGSSWSPAANAEPGNASVVWMQSHYGEYIRATVDYTNKKWKIHSTYDIRLPEGAPINSGGAGLDSLKPRRINGRLYLAQDAANAGRFGVWMIDEGKWQARAVSAVSFNADTSNHWTWTDANGDGIAQETEYRRYKWLSFYFYNAQNLRSDANLNYFAFDRDNTILRIPVVSYNAIGAPEYADISSPTALVWGSMPSETIKTDGFSDRYDASHSLSFANNGSVYGAIGLGAYTWAGITSAMVGRWGSDGKLIWKRKLGVAGGYDNGHPYTPGVQVWSAFKNNVGVVYGNMVAQDFNGGHASYGGQGITYVWNEDGLFVGGVFDSIDTSKVGARFYNLSSENGAGSLHEETATGSVLYFGGTESANHVYRLRGWGGWLRLSGTIDL